MNCFFAFAAFLVNLLPKERLVLIDKSGQCYFIVPLEDLCLRFRICVLICL